MKGQILKKWVYLGLLILCLGLPFRALAGNALNLDPWSVAIGRGLPTSGFANNNAMTIEAWVFHDELSDSRISRYVTVGGELGVIRHRSGNAGALQVYFSLNGANQGYTVNDLLQTGRWYHVAGVWDGAEIRLYLDGDLVGTPLKQDGKRLDYANDEVKVGHTTEYFDGRLDEVRIYDVALTLEDIRDRMHRELSGSESGLVAYYRFDESSGHIASDFMGNAGLNLNVNCSWGTSTAPVPVDFGDAPVPYPVTIAEEGAIHGVTGPSLGASRETEDDGIHTESLPEWLSFDPVSITYSGKAPGDVCWETFIIWLQASDGCSATENTFQLYIDNLVPRKVKSIGDREIKRGLPFSFSFGTDCIVDPEGQPLEYYASYPSEREPPRWISFDPATRTFSGTAPTDCGEVILVRVDGGDPCHYWYTIPDDEHGPGITLCHCCGSDSFNLYVNDDAPTINNPNADRVYKRQTAFSFSVNPDTFKDDFGVENLEFTSTLSSGEALPDWLNFDPATLTYSGTTPDVCATEYEIDLIANDGCQTASDLFFFSIHDDKPVINQVIPDQEILPSTQWEYIFPEETFSQPEGYELLYEAEETGLGSLPYWLNFDSAQRKFYGNAPSYQTSYSLSVWAHSACSDWVAHDFQLYLTNQ